MSSILAKRVQAGVYRLLVVLGALSCARGREPVAARSAALRFVPETEVRVRLRDDTASILAQPVLAWESPGGLLHVADGSDKDIKVYDGATGARLGAIGRVGAGPGEFSSLISAQGYRDSIVTSDFALHRISVLSSAGVQGREIGLASRPYDVRVLDDSLLLSIRHPGQGGNLLSISRMDGTDARECFDRASFFEDEQLRHLTAVFADGRDGVVFATVFGDDSIFAFSYRCRLLAAAPIETAVLPVGSLRQRLHEAKGQVRNASGEWFHDGINAVIKVVALDSATVALHIARYDTKVGTDPLEGGEIVAMRELGRSLAVVADTVSELGLMGRGRGGSLLLLGYLEGKDTGPILARWGIR